MGQTNFDVVTANAFIGSQFLTQGNTFFVRPVNGRDGNDGKSPKRAFKTLTEALAKCTAGQNDVVYLMAESDSAGGTTDYQGATLNWNKDLCHLIGVNSGPRMSQRSRVAFTSTYAGASNLFTLSANGCLIQGVEFYAGVASVNPTGCMLVTGERNHVRKCHIAGMGNTANDIAGAYSVQLSGAGAGENLFDDCVIGLNTLTLGAHLNSQILCAGYAARNTFRNCLVQMFTNHATNHVFLRAPAASIDRYLIFEDTQFLNAIDSGSTGLTEAFVVVATSNGTVLLLGGRTGFVGATDWNSTDSGNVRSIDGSITSATFGLGVAVTQS